MKWSSSYDREAVGYGEELPVECTHIAVVLGDDYVSATLIFVDPAGSVLPIRSEARSLEGMAYGVPSGVEYERMVGECIAAVIRDLVADNDYNYCFVGLPNWAVEVNGVSRQIPVATTEGPGRHKVAREHVTLLQNMAIESAATPDRAPCELFDCEYSDDEGVTRRGVVGISTGTLRISGQVSVCDRSSLDSIKRALRHAGVTKIACLSSTGPASSGLLTELDMRSELVLVDLDRHSMVASLFRRGRFVRSTTIDAGYCTMLDAAAERCNSSVRDLEWVWKGDRRGSAWMGVPDRTGLRASVKSVGKVFSREEWETVRSEVARLCFELLDERMRNELGVKEPALRIYSDNAISREILVEAARAANYRVEVGEVDRVHLTARCCRFPGFARTVAMVRSAMPGGENRSRWPTLENERDQKREWVRQAVATGTAVFLTRYVPVVPLLNAGRSVFAAVTSAVGASLLTIAEALARRTRDARLALRSEPAVAPRNLVGVLRPARSRAVSFQDGKKTGLAA